MRTLRLRMAKPTRPKPRSIIAQVAGSGTDEVALVSIVAEKLRFVGLKPQTDVSGGDPPQSNVPLNVLFTTRVMLFSPFIN